MNKTVKTIAWICLVLGLLGMAVEVGVYVRGRALVAQFQESIEAGEFPAFKGRFADMDEDGDIDDEDWEKLPSDRGEWFHFDGMRGGRKSLNTFSNSHGWLSSMRDGNIGRAGFAILFLLLAGGSVLTVVGAVILIVNREPKVSDSKEKKEKGKKK